MRFLLAIFILCSSARAATYQWTNAAAWTLGDSFSASYNWIQYVTNVSNCSFRYLANYAANGNSLKNVVEVQWPKVKEDLRTNSYPAEKVLFIMVGVNPNNPPPPSYVDPPDYTAPQFIAAWSNMVVEARTSNMLVYAFTITDNFNRHQYDSQQGWLTYYSTINTNLLTNGLAHWVQDNESIWPWVGFTTTNYPDGLHPSTPGYQAFATNVVVKLSAEAIAAIQAIRGSVTMNGKVTIR